MRDEKYSRSTRLGLANPRHFRRICQSAGSGSGYFPSAEYTRFCPLLLGSDWQIRTRGDLSIPREYAVSYR
ncbi:hypothetical protein QUF80_06495 [Desulfococcaceae bacterium HSG8]|nr:hypothetical protein [Desulfococcaceae bacterium HSG8]